MPSDPVRLRAVVRDEATDEVPQLKVPADLLAEVRRRHPGAQTRDFHVDGLRPSLFERVKRLLGVS
ncbi:MAG: hypothetical protein JOZ89_10170 [Gammaproteobacteria bacterium]|nr:hypothetical protein [Gammaproteobacteria bacterium]